MTSIVPSTAAHELKFSSRYHAENLSFFHIPGPDQILNAFLIYLRPTNITYCRLLFLGQAGATAGAYYLAANYKAVFLATIKPFGKLSLNSWLLQHLLQTATPSIPIDGLFLLHTVYMLTVLTLMYTNRTTFTSPNDWENPETFQRNRLPIHTASMRYTTTEKAARAQACSIELLTKNTPNVTSLDGTWNFMYTEDPETAKHMKWSKLPPSHPSWSKIPVPSNWQLSDNNPDIPIYTNIQYPFPKTPPYVPEKNPTGLYQRTFTLPTSYHATINEDRFHVLFHGVSSAFYVYLDGVNVGYSQDSCLPAEFDISTLIKLKRAAAGTAKDVTFTLSVICIRWSDGSFLEDQDHWWLSGIARNVELIRIPRAHDIYDFSTQTDKSGLVEARVHFKSTSGPRLAKKVSVRVYDDTQLDLSGKFTQGGQVFRVDAVVNSDDTTIVLSGMVDKPKLWSAEVPNLYTLIVETSDAADKVLQVESCRVGFKTVDITPEGIFKINDEAVTIAGVNRHDHDPDHGKTISVASMIEDVCVLKAANFNAVRTCHYPNSSEFYKLCDFLGLYMCDEANLETHGCSPPMGMLMSDPYWTEQVCSRITRMCQRDRNHASVCIWSLGNESGRGVGLTEARRRIRLMDPSRPIQYESGGNVVDGTGCTELTDIICPMYPSVEKTLELGTKASEDRPVILCEYSHAMGNSNGNLHLYWDMIWDATKPRIQGGFIWDMIDQGLRHTDKETGKEFWAYGGDFGGDIHDAQFCVNGLWSPDRKPHPAVFEAKRLHQPVTFTLHSTNEELQISGSSKTTPNCSVNVVNRYSFQDLSHLGLTWTVTSDSSSTPLSSGTEKIPKDGGVSKLFLTGCDAKSLLAAPLVPARMWLNVNAVLLKDTLWAAEGHIIGTTQFEIALDLDGAEAPGLLRKLSGALTGVSSPARSAGNPDSRITHEQTADAVTVTIDGNEDAVVDCKTGNLTAFATPTGKKIFASPLALNFTRAATDNDQGGAQMLIESGQAPAWLLDVLPSIIGTGLFSHKYKWGKAGMAQSNPPQQVCEGVTVDDKDESFIEIKCDATTTSSNGGKQLLNTQVVYRVHRNGDVQVKCAVQPSGKRNAFPKDFPSLARVGLSVGLDKSLFNVSFLGRGELENYPDRVSCADFGIFETTPEDMHVDYIFPSENGARQDCEWAAFADKHGGGLLVKGGAGFSFSAKLHSAAELDSAKHTYDLGTRKNGKDEIFVNLDHKIMGVGGDLSWLPCVYDAYLVSPKETYEFDFWLCPLAPGQSPIAQAKRPLGV